MAAACRFETKHITYIHKHELFMKLCTNLNVILPPGTNLNCELTQLRTFDRNVFGMFGCVEQHG